MNISDLKNKYKDASLEKLAEILDNSEDYTPEVVSVIKDIIEERGGLEKFQQEIAIIQDYENEKQLLRSHLQIGLRKNIAHSLLLKEIELKYLSKTEQDQILQKEVKLWEEERKDRAITSESVIKGILGGLVGGTVGGVIFGISMIGSGKIMFMIVFSLWVISYFFIWLFSRKTKRNTATIIITVFSSVYAFLLGQILLAIFGVQR
ncbi:MAG: hypothetical protein R3C61_02235 [Bacteroidia bacterium]